MRDQSVPETTAEAWPRLIAAVLVVGGLAAYYGAFKTLAVVAALIVVIALHELAHFVTARWSGMKVTEYFIGFGPRLWATHRNGVTYGVKAIPAGAYVRIIGMNNLDEVDPDDEPRTYRQQSYPKRVLVASAGSLMHFVLAFVMLVALFAGFGVVRDSTFQVGQVGIDPADTTPSAAERAGLEVGDRILAVDGQALTGWSELREILRDSPETTLRLTVLRGDRTLELEATPEAGTDPDTGETVGRLGVAADFPLQPMGPLSAVTSAGTAMYDIGWGSIKAIGQFFTPWNLADYVSGLGADKAPAAGDGSAGTGDDTRFLSPVGFVRVASQAADTGVAEVLQLLVLINIFVGVFNLLPLLPFDGGHIAVATYERLRSRAGRSYHADVARLLPLTYGVVMLLVLVGLSALWLDVSRPLDNPFSP